MKHNNHVCVIVDPFSTGKYIAPALISRGYKCVHIQSSKNLPSYLTASVRREDFIAHLVYDNNLEFILEQLSGYQIKLCLPGSESGVEVADMLAEKLQTPSNGITLSAARRDKFLMTEAVNQKGLNTAQHFKSIKREEIIAWVQTLNNYPVVLKPIKSASGDNVFICHNLEEVEHAFGKIAQSIDLFGENNTEVLAQSYIPGDEYIINTVSYDSNHYVAEIWQVERIPQTTVYDKCTLISSDNERYEALQNYTFKVLDALQIQYGAATTELKFNQEGPFLIECGSRLMGGAELSFSNDFFGYTQLSLMLEAYFEPQRFIQRLTFKSNVEPKYGVGVLLISNAEGKLQSNIDLAKELVDIKTLHCFEIDVFNHGQQLHKTVDLLTCPGTIYLMGSDKKEVLNDYQKIRQLEEKLYLNAITKPVNTASPISKSQIITHASFWSKENDDSSSQPENTNKGTMQVRHITSNYTPPSL